MGREEFQLLKDGVIKRKAKRKVGLFIDGLGLDRATRRLDKKVDLSRLVAGLTSGIQPEVARYYTLIPNEDDARQFSFLDAVERAGLEVVVKRLPPKGVKRQVSMDVHIATDLIAFGYGQFEKVQEEEAKVANANPADNVSKISPVKTERSIKRMANVVCPTREVSYAIYMCNQFGVETSLSDFGLYGTSTGWRGVDRWVDLSTSETIWRD